MKKPLNTTKIDPPAKNTTGSSEAKEKDKSLTNIPQPSTKRQKPIIPSTNEVMISQNLHKKKAEEPVQMKAIVDNEFKISVKTYAASHDMTLSDLIEKSLLFYMAAHP